MNEVSIHHLKQPCKNRGIELINNKDGSVTINGQRFDTESACVDYLQSITRKDLPNK